MATTTPSGVRGAGTGRAPIPGGTHGGTSGGSGGPRHAARTAPSSGTAGSTDSTDSTDSTRGTGPTGAAPMTHRQIMEALSGLLLGMFVAILSSTIVSNALPKIVGDLGGGQSSYTWVVTASLLTMTAATPLWGKLADLVSKKVLVQTAIVIFVLASASAGFAQNPGMLIASRAVQGIGMGGISALAQIVMASMIAPRERGRYTGYIGAAFALAMVSGPLLGGVITDTEWLGWRWCFYVGIPFAVIALVLLQKTLRLPVVKRDVRVDWPGAFLVAAAASLLLIWVTFAGDKYDWVSWQTYAMVGGSVLLALLFVLVESKVREPLLPLHLFRDRTIALTSLGSLFVGISMFSATVYLSQYFQLARGQSPTMAGMSTIPLITGLFLSTTVSGRIITRTGRWKVFLCSGGVLLSAGIGLLGTLRHDTPYWHAAIFMALTGVGVGMMMQNLVLATQNQVPPGELGVASSTLNFFRSLGGAVGVSVFGAVLSHRLSGYVSDGLHKIGVDHGPTGGSGSSTIPDLAGLPAPVRGVIEGAYGHGIGDIYLFATPVAMVALLVVLCIKEVPLKGKSGIEQAGSAGDGVAEAAADAGANVPAHDGQYGQQYGQQHGQHGQQYGQFEQQGRPFGQGDQFGQHGQFGQQHDQYGLSSQGSQYGQPGQYGGQSRGRHAQPSDEQAQFGQTGFGVRGVIRTAEGHGVARAAVTLISLGGRQLGRSVARADGSYGLDAPGPGSYVLIAAADGHQPQASTILIGEEVLSHDVLLSATSGLAGQVRNALDGAGVPGAMVVVTDVRGEVLATGRAGEQGEFRFDELVAGTFTLAVNAPGFRPVAQPVEIDGQGVSRVEIQLAAGARVQGVIRAGGGRRPLPDARVTLVDAAGNVIASATTGEDGAYAFTDLDSGEYSVIASGYPPVASGLDVDGTGVDDHEIELHHPDE